MREVVCGKIHKATVTEADISYVGSITIDVALLEKADLWPGQKVLVVSNTNGARLETYTIAGERNSGQICMNGAAAHLIQKDHEVVIIGFCFVDQAQQVQPKMVLVDQENRFVSYL